jgi:uncharacterized protein YlbG (UPF0298 family)
MASPINSQDLLNAGTLLVINKVRNTTAPSSGYYADNFFTNRRSASVAIYVNTDDVEKLTEAIDMVIAAIDICCNQYHAIRSPKIHFGLFV